MVTRKPEIKSEATLSPSVLRAKAPLNKIAKAKLKSLIERPWQAQVETFAEMAKLAQRAHAPLDGLLETNGDAQFESVALQRRQVAVLDARLAATARPRFMQGPEVASLIPALHDGINVFGPPYDFQVTEPSRGRVHEAADRMTGAFGLTINWGDGGGRWATAGVGLALKAGVQGIAHVRPCWSYVWQGIAQGFILDSHSEGAGRVVIQDAITGDVMHDQPHTLWNFDNDRWEEDSGYIDPWKLGADVFVNAGQIIRVMFLATALVADSGPGYAWSLARASIDMRALFVVVEMGS